jgi:hypothetical protein
MRKKKRKTERKKKENQLGGNLSLIMEVNAMTCNL